MNTNSVWELNAQGKVDKGISGDSVKFIFDKEVEMQESGGESKVRKKENGEIVSGSVLDKQVEVEDKGIFSVFQGFILRALLMKVRDDEYEVKNHYLLYKAEGRYGCFIDFCEEVWSKGVSEEEFKKITEECMKSSQEVINFCFNLKNTWKGEGFEKVKLLESKHRKTLQELEKGNEVYEENFGSLLGRFRLLVEVLDLLVDHFEFSDFEKKIGREKVVKVLREMLEQVIGPKIKAEIFSEEDRQDIERYGDLVGLLACKGFIEEKDFYELFPICGKERIYGELGVVSEELINLLGKSSVLEHWLLSGSLKLDKIEYDKIINKTSEILGFVILSIVKDGKDEIKVRDVYGDSRKFIETYFDSFYEELPDTVELIMEDKHRLFPKNDNGYFSFNIGKGIGIWLMVLEKCPFKCSEGWCKEKTMELLGRFRDAIEERSLEGVYLIAMYNLYYFGMLLFKLKGANVITEGERVELLKGMVEVINFD